jgi:Ca-activated chloride channel family protein
VSFDAPLVVWAAPLVGALIAVLAMWARRARIVRARRWSAALGAHAAGAGRFGAIGLGLAATVAMVALAGPRWGSRVVTAETKGLNVVIAVDISRSMLAEDESPSRLERAKRHANRLVQDLTGDRVGLVAFAGQSFILSPLTIDASALHLLIDALDPDLTSAGGTELARVLSQGRELLVAGDPVADRVLVLFTDGEAHDSLPGVREAAARLRRDGIRLILVAEGGVEPERIPVRDADDSVIGYQRDPSGETVFTTRRDDLLAAVADESHGVIVAAELSDQVGAVLDLVAGYKRSPQATSTAAQDIARAWIPMLAAVLVLLVHTLTRRTMALASLALLVATAPQLVAQGPRNRADEAWRAEELREAAQQYLAQVQMGEGGDTSWFNLGTAALAIRDTATARRALERAAESLDPEVRFRARFNLGLLLLRRAAEDTSEAAQHLDAARRHYREALLLRPGDRAAKWNLELATRLRPPDPSSSAGSGGQGGSASEQAPEPPRSRLDRTQAEQILNSMSEEERRTLLERNRRRREGRETRGRKDW